MVKVCQVDSDTGLQGQTQGHADEDTSVTTEKKETGSDMQYEISFSVYQNVKRMAIFVLILVYFF